MLLDINHITEFQYAEAVRESVMEVWMQPRKGGGQRLVNFELETDPAAQLFSYADAYGNAVYHFDAPRPHTRLRITARASVDTEMEVAPTTPLDMGEWDRLRSDFVRGENFDFLRHHGFAAQSPALIEFVVGSGIERLRVQDPLSAVRALSETIYRAFAYQPGVTDAQSPIDVALAAKRGVCQDFAHIFIAICRSWGVPARYVSGYLFTDRALGDRSDPDATHAWVEVYLPSLRWVGIDPTNNTMAGERHIVVAVGRDYNDVPPTRGVFKGDSDSLLAVAVAVSRSRAAPSEPEFIRLAQPAFQRAGRRAPQTTAAFDQQIQQQQQQQQ